MNRAYALLLLLPAAVLAREESIGEMSARFRQFCNQQPKEVRAECHQNARDRVAMESARREADRADQDRRRRDKSHTSR